MRMVKNICFISILLIVQWNCAEDDLMEADLLIQNDNEFEEIIEYSSGTIPFDYQQNQEHIVSFDKTSIEIRKTYSDYGSLIPGAILISPYENYDPEFFFIRKIISVQDIGRSIVLTVEEGRMDEAFDRLNFRVPSDKIFKNTTETYRLFELKIPSTKTFSSAIPRIQMIGKI